MICSKTLKLITTLISLLIFIGYTNSEVAEKNCKSILSDLTKRQLTGIANCTKSMTFKNGKEKAAKMNCILKCVMSNEGLLNVNGTLSQDDLDRFLEKEFPKKMLETIQPLFQKCRDTAGEALDPTEEFCKSYDPFIKCLMGAIGTMCPKPK